MPSLTQIRRFCKTLQDYAPPPNVRNFYAARRTNARRRNLERYLLFMAERAPSTLLVGEAPGHNGCARTGVPFSSERLLREGVLGGRLFGPQSGFSVGSGCAHAEQSARAMWEVLDAAQELPLLWNAYPFHPHRPGDPDSNRKPLARELAEGEPFLKALIELFGITRVIAVGNAADTVLRGAGISHAKVRHPAHGGKPAFVRGLGRLLGPEADGSLRV